METTVFYAWQNDREPATHRYLVQDAAKSAVKRIGSEGSVEDSPRLDQDTKNVPGTPNVADTIFGKIDSCGVFLADVTFVGATVPAEGPPKLLPNPNVLIELGYAAKAIGWERIITVMNVAYGGPEQLPFDLRYRRFPIRYDLKDADAENLAREKKALAESIEYAIRAIVAGAQPKTQIDFLDSRSGSVLGDTLDVVRPFLHFARRTEGHHTTYSAIPMPDDDDFERYLDHRNRTLWLHIGLVNRGTVPLTNIIVDLEITGVKGVRLSPEEPPKAGLLFSPDIRRSQVDPSRPVYVDSEKVLNGTARVRQRAATLTPNVREALVPLGLLALNLDKTMPFSVRLQATDAKGRQTTRDFVAQVRFDGAQTLGAQEVRALLPDDGF